MNVLLLMYLGERFGELVFEGASFDHFGWEIKVK